jgi:Flp pilus assembly protein TadG
MIRSLFHCERGNSVIELGFVAPILATIIIGTVDLSMAYSAELALEQAAQRTIERVQANTYNTGLNPSLKTEAEAAAGAGSTATVSAWLECSDNGTKLDFTTGDCSNTEPFARHVELQVQAPFNPMFGRFFPGAGANGTVTLVATAGVRVQ